MSPSTNTRSGPTAPIETIALVPTTLPITLYITRSEMDNTIKYIHPDMKAYIDKTYTKMKGMNDHIAYMLAKIIDTSVNQNKQ